MALTDLTTPQYPMRAGILAVRVSVFDPCTRKAKLGVRKGYVTQAASEVGFTLDYADAKTIEIKSANPFRPYNGRWIFPPNLKGGTLELTFNPGIYDIAQMVNPGANILDGSEVIGWLDYVGPMSEQLCVEVWRLLNWGPECDQATKLVEREVFWGGYPREGAHAYSTGDGEAESASYTLELQAAVPSAPVVLTGTVTVSGDATLEVSSTADLSVGDLISAAGVTAGTRILSITDATHLEMTANASASATVTATFSYGGPFGDFPLGAAVQLDAAYGATKETFRARFYEDNLPSTLTGYGFITIT